MCDKIGDCQTGHILSSESSTSFLIGCERKRIPTTLRFQAISCKFISGETLGKWQSKSCKCSIFLKGQSCLLGWFCYTICSTMPPEDKDRCTLHR